MPTGQQYATNVPQTFITSQISPTATVMSVNSSAGWPATPFTAVLEIGTSLQEPVDVTNVTGTTWTILRGVDSTSGLTHQVNATVTHGDIGRDFRESRSHIDASSTPDAVGHAVHGLANASFVVGTTDAQVLTNKTISAGTYTGAQAMGTGAWTGTGSLTENAIGITGLTGAANSTRIAGATAGSGGPPTSGTFVTGDIVTDTIFNLQWLCTSGGTPGTWVPMSDAVQSNSFNFSGSVSTTTVALPTTLTPYFSNMKIVIMGNTSFAGGDEAINLRLNGDTAAHYEWQYLGWTNAGAANNNAGASVSMMAAGFIGGSGGSGHTEIEIPNYKGTVTNAFRTMSFNSSVAQGITANANNFSTFGGGSWNSSAAITGVTIFNGSGANFSANTTVSVILYK